MHLVDGDVGSEVLVEAGHHVLQRVVVGRVVGEREDLGVHAELDRAGGEVVLSREDCRCGISYGQTALVNRHVGLAKHACREGGRAGGVGEGRRGEGEGGACRAHRP